MLRLHAVAAHSTQQQHTAGYGKRGLPRLTLSVGPINLSSASALVWTSKAQMPPGCTGCVSLELHTHSRNSRLTPWEVAVLTDTVTNSTSLLASSCVTVADSDELQRMADVPSTVALIARTMTEGRVMAPSADVPSQSVRVLASGATEAWTLVAGNTILWLNDFTISTTSESAVSVPIQRRGWQTAPAPQHITYWESKFGMLHLTGSYTAHPRLLSTDRGL